jgi:biopolymer transport protein TolR
MAAVQLRRSHRGRYQPMADINVTPMVDVMLVLLVIFMVTAPLLTSSVNVDLPQANATPINQDSEPLQVSVTATGEVYLMNEPVHLADLVAKLQAISQDHKDRRIFVRGDRANTYGRMMQVMATIIQGGFTKVSLLTEQVGSGGGAPPGPQAVPGAPAVSVPAVPAPAPAAPPPAGTARPARG